MTPNTLFRKTMPFCWMKLILGIATVLASALLFAVIVGLASLFGSDGAGFGVLLWLVATGIVRFFIMHYAGYLVKAGHVAVLATAVAGGKIPANPVEHGKRMVQERFTTSNVYFAVDKLVGGAVKQLQGMLGRAGGLLNGVPGIGSVVKIGQMFIDISLGYVDECCLGYTFLQKDQGAFQSAADGVVIYAQNWKALLKNAAQTTLLVIAALAVSTGASFLIIGGLFRLLNWNMFVAFLLAAMVAFAIKFAFVDSWILVKTMSAYMHLAQSTHISYDLYGNLCNLSGKFRELFDKGRREGGAQPAYAAPEAPLFCGQCGTQSAPGDAHCAACGAPLQAPAWAEDENA